ncbi:Uncharacterised protein [Bordetella pertussis]|nr:Uncharacterised protein [Bordetella pertussis]CFW09555.1 Uncharacterised protein [Bordetella pertussis]
MRSSPATQITGMPWVASQSNPAKRASPMTLTDTSPTAGRAASRDGGRATELSTWMTVAS